MPGALVDERDRDLRGLLATIPMFAELSEQDLELALSRCRTVHLEAGQICVREGDPSAALYVVINGRLQAVGEEDPRREISRGQVFGEIGMLTGQRRTATVRAVRDSELLLLPREEFDRLAHENPQWLRNVARIVVDRFVPSQSPSIDVERVLTLGLYGLGESSPVVDVAAGLLDALRGDAPAASGSARDVTGREARLGWAHRLESSHRYVLYEGSSGAGEWRRWCLSQSDRVVLVADARARPEGLPPDLAEEVSSRAARGVVWLLLVHPGTRSWPEGVTGWLEKVPGARHLNLRSGRPDDLARAARLLTGRGCGLVLGGGGPRGFAHLGVMRALDEAEVPVDAVGGTSIGAVLGVLRAFDIDDRSRRDWAMSSFVESGHLFAPTLPLLSFSSARKIRRLLEGSGGVGDRTIETCWLPYFCISANLTQASMVVHDRGPLASAIRASLSLPGIFPPVRRGDDLLVDGGVINNLPVDVMRSRLGGGTVIAVDVSVDVEMAAAPDYRETPSGWTLLLDRVRGHRSTPAPPNALSVLMRAKELAAIQAQRDLLDTHEPDLLIRPPVGSSPMFDFHAARHLIDLGYRQASAQLEAGEWAERHW